MGASIECREPFLDPRLIVGLGSFRINYFYRNKFILRNAMQDRLPDEILKFRKVGLSA
jgi:asparagine synthase (glutamine-hydrolysing)